MSEDKPVKEVAEATVGPVDPGDNDVAAILSALTADLATFEYTPEQTFGYSLEQLQQKDVRLIGARCNGHLVAVGGLELQGDGYGELKRFYVDPAFRGQGLADQILDALFDLGRQHDVRWVRLETGDRQHAALRFYHRHGFTDIDRFGAYVDSATSVCLQRELA